ncbi:MAG: hypothetical protein ACSHXY_15295 [Alphaproteobacteria bacterium]
MKNFIKMLSVCTILGFAAAPSHAANNAPNAQPTITASYSQKPTPKRRVVRRIEHKYVATRASHNKHLVTLTNTSQAYGKVVIPLGRAKKMPNLFRP